MTAGILRHYCRPYYPITQNATHSQSIYVRIAFILLCCDQLFMTRAYALSNFVETILFGLFLLVPFLRSEFIRALRDPIVLSLMLFFVWCLLSGLWSSAPLVNVLQDWWGWRKLLLFPIGLVLFQYERYARIALCVAIGVAAFFLALITYASIMDLSMIWDRTLPNVLQNHNAQGIYFAIVGFSITLITKRVTDAPWLRILMICLGLSFLLFTAMVGTSRAGYVAFVICFTLMIFWLLKGRVFSLFVGIGLGFLVLFVSPIAENRIKQAVSEIMMGVKETGGKDTSGSIRVVMWKNTVQMVAESPFLGTGAAAFDRGYSNVVVDQTGWRAAVTDDPHNQYLHIAAEYGLVGLLLFLLFMGNAYRSINISDPFGILLLSTISVSAVTCTFSGVFGNAIEGRIFLLFFAIFLSLSRHEKKPA